MSTTIGSPSNQHLIRYNLTGLVRSGRGQSKKSFLKAIYAIARTIGIKRRVILYDRCVSLSNFYLESYLEGKQRFSCGLILYRQHSGTDFHDSLLTCYVIHVLKFVKNPRLHEVDFSLSNVLFT